MPDKKYKSPPPQFAHDCNKCIFLGHFNGLDLYYCAQNGRPTVIARYGNGADYTSGLDFATPYFNLITGKIQVNEFLAEAKKRAVAAGLLPLELIL